MLYADNYQAAELTFGNRGDEEVLAAASIAYNEKEYSKALALFGQAKLSQTGAKLILAQSICHIELGQYEQAQQKLSSALNDPLYGDQCR